MSTRSAGPSGSPSSPIILDSTDDENSTVDTNPIIMEDEDDEDVERLHTSWFNKVSQMDGHPRQRASPLDQCQQQVDVTIDCKEISQYSSEVSSAIATSAAEASGSLSSPIILDSTDDENSTADTIPLVIEDEDDEDVETLHTFWFNKVSQMDDHPRLHASPLEQFPQQVAITIDSKENVRYHSELTTSSLPIRTALPSDSSSSLKILDLTDDQYSTTDTIPLEMKNDHKIEILRTSWVNKVSQGDNSRLCSAPFDQWQWRDTATANLLQTQDINYPEEDGYPPAYGVNCYYSHSSSVSFASESTSNAKCVWWLNNGEKARIVSIDSESTNVTRLSSGSLNTQYQPDQPILCTINVLNEEGKIKPAHQHVKWSNNVEELLKLPKKPKCMRNSSYETMKIENGTGYFRFKTESCTSQAQRGKQSKIISQTKPRSFVFPIKEAPYAAMIDAYDENITEYQTQPTSHLRYRTSSFSLINKETFLEQCINAYSKAVDFENFMKSFSQPRKIGEGPYGDVYNCWTKAEEFLAIKIIPVDGFIPVRDDKQPSWSEMLPNLTTSLYLNTLKDHTGPNLTSNFAHLYSVHCVIGEYPDTLLKAWEKHDSLYGSENKNPEVFNKYQKYLVRIYDFAGVNLKNFEYANVAQVLSTFLQVACCLAVAEKAFQFEHRNLHLGNILLKPTTENQIHFRLEGEDFQVASHAIHVTLIDISLSRLNKGNHVAFTDLRNEPSIFQGVGDYQFEIYCIMRDQLDERWESFCPKTNVIWLHYLLLKLCNEKQYKVQRQNRGMMNQLKEYTDQMLTYNSAYEFVTKHVKGQL